MAVMDGATEPPNRLTSGEIRRRLEEITRFRLTGQLERMVEHFSPDVIVHYNCTQVGLFTPGIWRGRAAFLANMRLTEENYEALEGEITEVLVENGNAALRWRTCWRHRGTGGVYTCTNFWIIRGRWRLAARSSPATRRCCARGRRDWTARKSSGASTSWPISRRRGGRT
jgi:hypothetical protein